ncbi:polyamine aminopropyltransferase [Parapusillimonas granuli]|uniref:Polyamine aminopropyltransferase n=1 Tax=Parapusillimonas granuli TaxID=380911 RepID=A0A853G2B2_9BURK|nr:polyamine aminopropyltransferase [Parapusillimonas granuli]MBB5213996.1 spermidine synthase [Parapusillimonas granuli]NYT50417.1 polyamine aminopropyltransferase [Parapusillimonas granuli]
MQGLHLTADLYQCACDPALLTDAALLAELCRGRTLDSGLTLVNEKWHTFPDFDGHPGGVTGALLLAESHLAIHTWPERGGITLDVYVCNFMADNSGKAEALLHGLVEVFQPGKAQYERLQRGDENGPGANGELLLESLNDTSAFGFRFARRLHAEQTPYQRLEILESKELGRCLRLDGLFMTSEADEFFYHEALVHPAALAHPAPAAALVIGGGDGGAIEELLKHPSLRDITLVELDQRVVDAARQYLPSIHKNAFDDPRVRLLFQDGARFMADTPRKFDLILLDLTDPETPAGPLYTREFFQLCQSALTADGALVMHLGAPFHEKDQVRDMSAKLASVFKQVHGYGLHIPLYGAYWALAVASDTLDPTALDAATVSQRLRERGIGGLQYYNEGVHAALFALPNFYRALMPAVKK